MATSMVWLWRRLINVEQQLGNFQKALECYEMSLEIKIKSLGIHHVDVARTYNNMGNVEDSLGNYQKALEYH